MALSFARKRARKQGRRNQEALIDRALAMVDGTFLFIFRSDGKFHQ
ncbi:hypothetical protein NKH33_11095 [Mesorhizobium sp. M1182]